jgi:hypothetical protein
MSLDQAAFEEGVRNYWTVIASRSTDVQNRERAFSALAQQFASRNPPFFTRAELHEIICWKHTDARRRNRALTGVAAVSDERLQNMTGALDGITEPCCAAAILYGQIQGVGNGVGYPCSGKA